MYDKIKEDMKKLILIIGIILIMVLSAFEIPKDKDSKKTDEEKSKKETTKTTEIKPVVSDDKLKEDIQKSVLEFIGDLKINPDTCYIPFKK